MSAAFALETARAAGIRVRIDGDDLALEAPAPPPGEVFNLLARHKVAIVTLLRQANDGWAVEDWKEFFDKRVRISEFNGSLRDEAEATAFSWCVSEWLDRHPVRSEAGVCEFCNRSQGLLQPYLTDDSLRDPGHTWLHQECSQKWHQERRAKAVAELVTMGIAIPVKFAERIVIVDQYNFSKNEGS